VILPDHHELLKFAVSKIAPTGAIWREFGVFTATSTNIIAGAAYPRKVSGFEFISRTTGGLDQAMSCLRARLILVEDCRKSANNVELVPGLDTGTRLHRR